MKAALPPNLCEANEFVAAPHICFSLTNGGNIAVVDKVQATIEVIRHSGQVGLKKTSSFIPVGREIEIGQMLGKYSVRLDDFGICDLQEIRSGETPLKIIFQIISKDMFGNDHKPSRSILTMESRFSCHPNSSNQRTDNKPHKRTTPACLSQPALMRAKEWPAGRVSGA
jgi:hypothetical protein